MKAKRAIRSFRGSLWTNNASKMVNYRFSNEGQVLKALRFCYTLYQKSSLATWQKTHPNKNPAAVSTAGSRTTFLRICWICTTETLWPRRHLKHPQLVCMFCSHIGGMTWCSHTCTHNSSVHRFVYRLRNYGNGALWLTRAAKVLCCANQRGLTLHRVDVHKCVLRSESVFIQRKHTEANKPSWNYDVNMYSYFWFAMGKKTTASVSRSNSRISELTVLITAILKLKASEHQVFTDFYATWDTSQLRQRRQSNQLSIYSLLTLHDVPLRFQQKCINGI